MHLIDKKSWLRNLAATLSLTVAPLAACEKGPPEAVPAADPGEQQVVASTCGDRGVLQAQFTGAIGAKIDWPDDALRCESMPRPGAEGVRLRFSGDVGAQRLAIIIALPGLHAGDNGTEFNSNVTITVEGSGRFFSTPNLDTCWTDIAINEPLEDGSDTHIVQGGLSCVGPLGEINGDGFIDIQLLRFSGIADWNAT